MAGGISPHSPTLEIDHLPFVSGAEARKTTTAIKFHFILLFLFLHERGGGGGEEKPCLLFCLFILACNPFVSLVLRFLSPVVQSRDCHRDLIGSSIYIEQ